MPDETTRNAANVRDRVIVKVTVFRAVLEPRTDVDGVEDFYVIKNEIVSEREWVEDREKALREVVESERAW